MSTFGLGRDNEDIKERWMKYFDKLFNGNDAQDADDLTIPSKGLATL